MSKPEVVLWLYLRRSQPGFGFRRQHPIGPFVADFYSPVVRLVIETDGHSHESSGTRDRARDQYMNELGINVMRIPARNVLREARLVASWIRRRCENLSALKERTPHPPPASKTRPPHPTSLEGIQDP
jgi:very-short-patch-repair endonuclease